MNVYKENLYSRLQKSCNTQAERWKTTIDLPCMNLIIFPTSAFLPLCSSSINQLWFSTVQLDCCKTFAIHCTWLQFYRSLALILTIVHTCMSFKTAGCIIFHWFHILSFHHLLLLLFLLQSCTTHSMLAFPLTPTHLPCLTSHTVAASVCKL